MGIRFGLIGCGWIVERDHTPAMLRSDNVSIVATAYVSVGRIARLDHRACLTDYRAVLDRDDVGRPSITTTCTTSSIGWQPGSSPTARSGRSPRPRSTALAHVPGSAWGGSGQAGSPTRSWTAVC